MKNIYIYSIIAVAVVGGVIFGMSRNNKTNNVADTSNLFSPNPSLSQSPVPSQTPKLIKSSPKPTSGLIAKAGDNYQYYVNLMDPLNRRLTLDSNCTSIVPSQMAYPNNTQVMLDNTLSTSPRVLKIGTKEYSLGANSWSLVTLNSPTLPAQLTMFCGSMELGQIDLQ